MSDSIGLDPFLQWLKRWQRRFYFADYADDRFRLHWLQKDPSLPYEEIAFPIRPEPEAVKTILIFKPDEIGDAVQSLPAIVELKAHFPQARLFLICQDKARAVYDRSGLFDEISATPVKMRFLRFPILPLNKALGALSVKEFDLAIFLRTYPAHFKNFLKLPAKIKLHPKDPRLSSRSIYQATVNQWGETRHHQAMQLLETVARITGKKYSSADIRYPQFRWQESDRSALELTFGKTPPPKFIIVHPFAKYETRRYPESYWNEILNHLAKQNIARLVIIGGKEDPQWSGLDNAIQMQGKLSLAQTGFLLSQASAFLGNESGPAHLAAALGVPSITLMGGHSLPNEWAPLGRSLILRADVPCSPCHRRVCPGFGLACLRNLTTEKVLPAIELFLQKEFLTNPS